MAVTIPNNSTVTKTHKKYDKYAPKWKRVRDVLAGQDEIHAGDILYLPKLNEQTPDQYKAYKKRASFFNASWRTVASLLGLMFRKPPENKLPTGIEEYLKDVSMRGVPFDNFAEEFALEWLALNFVGVLTDHPPAPPVTPGSTLTTAMAATVGLRPTMQIYKAETIRNWRHARINNKWRLTQVVLGECTMVDVNEFEQVEEARYRVLDLDASGFYRQRLYKVENGEDVLVEGPTYPLMDGNPLTDIPFEADFDFEEPPLIDLIDTNLTHYLVSADYYHALHFTGLPTPVVTGYQPTVPQPGAAVEKLYIGSETAWVFPDANAKAFYLEFTGAGLTELREARNDLKEEMAHLGAKALATEKAGVEAFKTQASRNSGENSILASIAINVSLKLKASLITFAAWAGSPDDKLEYELNRDFLPVTMDAPTLVAIVGAWQSGALSEGEMFDMFKRGDMVDADKTLEDHQSEIDAAPPPAPLPAPVPGKPGEPAPKPTQPPKVK